jgi:hypothetical protein
VAVDQCERIIRDSKMRVGASFFVAYKTNKKVKDQGPARPEIFDFIT